MFLSAITMTALLENPEQDFLGTVYHNLGLSKSQAGQFFTPYNVGQMMARINMPDSLVLDKSRILRVNDPCCGAGCLLLAGYNVMREQLESTDPDWDKYVLFVAQDIDPLVCKMCYMAASSFTMKQAKKTPKISLPGGISMTRIIPHFRLLTTRKL